MYNTLNAKQKAWFDTLVTLDTYGGIRTVEGHVWGSVKGDVKGNVWGSVGGQDTKETTEERTNHG